MAEGFILSAICGLADFFQDPGLKRIDAGGFHRAQACSARLIIFISAPQVGIHACDLPCTIDVDQAGATRVAITDARVVALRIVAPVKYILDLHRRRSLTAVDIVRRILTGKAVADHLAVFTDVVRQITVKQGHRIDAGHFLLQFDQPDIVAQALRLPLGMLDKALGGIQHCAFRRGQRCRSPLANEKLHVFLRIRVEAMRSGEHPVLANQGPRAVRTVITISSVIHVYGSHSRKPRFLLAVLDLLFHSLYIKRIVRVFITGCKRERSHRADQ